MEQLLPKSNLEAFSSPAPHVRRHGPAALAILAVALVVVGLLAAGIGDVRINPDQAISIILNEFGIKTSINYEQRQQTVLIAIRLPRVVLGMLVGASLATAGAAMQGLFRNPLADPGLIGVSSGAAFAVSIVIGLEYMLDRQFAPLFFTTAAFLGGLLTTLLIYRLSTSAGKTNVATMLLAGVAVNALAGAGVGLLVFLAGGLGAVQDFSFWSLGSLNRATWDSIVAILPFILLTLIVLPLLARPLNILLLGESEAGHLGINVERTKQIVVILAALAVGSGVATAGVIGFVGLVVPHLLRLTVGPDHRFVLPGSALLGATLLVGADLLARVIAPQEIPLGIITALVGGPFFLWLLLRDRNRGTLL